MDQPLNSPLEVLARRLATAVTVTMLVLAAAVVAAVGTGGFHSTVLSVEPDQFGLGDTPARILTGLSGLAALAFLYHLRRVFRAVARGDVFGSVVSRDLVRGAWCLLGSCIVEICGPFVISLASAASLDREFHLSFSGTHGLLLLSAGTFFVVSKLIERAAALETDSNQIV